MDDAQLMQLGMMVIGAICAAILVALIIWPRISGEKKVERRIATATQNRKIRAAIINENEAQQSRRKEVSEKLKDLEERSKKTEKVTLRLLLMRAGLDITPNVYWLISAVTGVVIAVLVFFSFPGVHPIAAILAGFAGVVGLPRLVLSKLIKRRQKKFLADFANSIDVIVRGVKSGLPLTECLNIIAREAADPMGMEFRELVEQQRVGVPLTEAFDRMIRRLPLPEVRFFAIVVGIQSQAGGNLSEALGNLSGVLRARKGMAAKVAALSSEAKASAGILASLPIVVMTMVYISTPDYISVLWTTKTGQFLMVLGAFWMSLGIISMKKMINFKY